MSSGATRVKPVKSLTVVKSDQSRQRSAAYHWPEYLIEAAALGTFMVSACLFSVLLDHPTSLVYQTIRSEMVRRALAGLAMGLTAIAIIYSPWGKRSGAHMNPSVTLAFLRLGRITWCDALFFIGAQFAGGALAVGIAAALFRNWVAHQSVNYAVTKPGDLGTGTAFAAEFFISFLLIWVVLNMNANPKAMRFTGVVSGSLVFLFIWLEAPFSGMSMNPARSFASAVWPRFWASQWIYFVAPPVAMLAAAELFKRQGRARQGCAKFAHDSSYPCIFCGHPGNCSS